jgi:hypothetical protein
MISSSPRLLSLKHFVMVSMNELPMNTTADYYDPMLFDYTNVKQVHRYFNKIGHIGLFAVGIPVHCGL